MTTLSSLLLVSVLTPAQCPLCGSPQTSLSFQNGNGLHLSLSMQQPQAFYGAQPTFSPPSWSTYSPGFYSAGTPQLYGAPVSYGGCNGGQAAGGFAYSRFHFGRNGFRGQSMQSYGQGGFQPFAGSVAFGGSGMR